MSTMWTQSLPMGVLRTPKWCSREVHRSQLSVFWQIWTPCVDPKWHPQLISIRLPHTWPLHVYLVTPQKTWQNNKNTKHILFCAQESQKSWTCICLRFPTLCSAHRSSRISESIFVWDFRRFVLRTGVPEFLKVHCLRFPTFCSAHRSPRNPKSPLF